VWKWQCVHKIVRIMEGIEIFGYAGRFLVLISAATQLILTDFRDFLLFLQVSVGIVRQIISRSFPISHAPSDDTWRRLQIPPVPRVCPAVCSSRRSQLHSARAEHIEPYEELLGSGLWQPYFRLSDGFQWPVTAGLYGRLVALHSCLYCSWYTTWGHDVTQGGAVARMMIDVGASRCRPLWDLTFFSRLWVWRFDAM
jgi:hypothetical protein